MNSTSKNIGRDLPARVKHVAQTAAVSTVLLASSAQAQTNAQTNLLTNNAGFESTAPTFGASNGAYTLPGWNGENWRYASHNAPVGSVGAGTTTEGTRAFHMDWAGTLYTAPNARAAASAGYLYELRFDLRTVVSNFSGDHLGTFNYIEFFDASGKLIKRVWGPNWQPQVQSDGVHAWETVTVRGLAPAGTASVGARVSAPAGMYASPVNHEDNRSIEVDNFRLFQLPETVDQIAVRRAPRLVEPGKIATIKAWSGATANRSFIVRLVDAKNVVRATASQNVPAGRGLRSFSIAIPDNLPNGKYSWQLGLLPLQTAWKPNSSTRYVANVVCDQSVTLPVAGSTEIEADNARVVYMGRWDDRDAKKPAMSWFGSQASLRFSGTSLSMRGGCGSNGYGGAKPSSLSIVIDGDETKLRTIDIDRENGVFTLASGLKDGVHTARLFKLSESDTFVRFDGFGFDANRGLLVSETLSSRKLEIFGDSVTSGGTADPTYFGYAPTLGRELDLDTHIVSKGGTGVASSFSGQTTLLNYWNNWTLPNPFDATIGGKWDTRRWQPDLALIMIGHNDQFNDGLKTFTARYADFHKALRAAYPQARIVGGNTLISSPIGMMEGALVPLTKIDKKLSWVMQLMPSTDPKTGHPDTAAHQTMVYGDAARFSYADVLEERMGWGLKSPAASASVPVAPITKVAPK